MVGVPGSGKTTYARANFPRALRISLDDLRLMFSGRTFDPRIEPAVAAAAEALLEAMARYAAEAKVDLVYDATNVTRARRARPIALAQRYGLTPVAIHFDLPLPIAQRRNLQRSAVVPPNVVESFGQRLEPPTLEEGFSEIIHVPEEYAPPGSGSIQRTGVRAKKRSTKRRQDDSNDSSTA